MRSFLLLPFLLASLAPAGAAAPDRPLVAVIDSGIARTPELAPVLVGEYDMAAEPARPAFHPRYDHGTMVATIINREAHGSADIVSFRIDDPAGCPPDRSPPCQPDTAPIVTAIDQAVDMGARAINISLEMKKDPAIIAAVRHASERGVTVVLAAGNEGRDRPGNLAVARAGYPNTVLVGALDPDGRPWAHSNRPGPAHEGGYTYVWRPGVDVPTVSAEGVAVTGTGTSFAAPIETAHRVLAEGSAASVALR